jgi:hypothetical protein
MFRSRKSAAMPNVFSMQLQQVKAKVEQAQALLEQANQMAFDLPTFSPVREKVKVAVANTIGKNIHEIDKTLDMIERVESNIDMLK